MNVEAAMRGSNAYALAAAALEAMQAAGVWPTPLNYELWIGATAAPDGALAREIAGLKAKGEVITEALSEEMAERHLPRSRLQEQVRDAGEHLEAQMEQIARVMAAAQQRTADYGETLAGASERIGASADGKDVSRWVELLTSATRVVQRENSVLEQRLTTSTEEVRRLREHLENAQHDAMTDGLSDLPNRKAFDRSLQQACAEAAASGKPLSLAVLDIDHFKRFNDTWGHQTGDQVIRYVASVLKHAGCAPRLAARYGGEEFALLMPGERASMALAMLDQVRREIGSRNLKRRSTEEDLGAVTVSIGVAELRSKESHGALVERADAALYASKRNGRNRLTNAEEPAPRAAAA